MDTIIITPFKLLTPIADNHHYLIIWLIFTTSLKVHRTFKKNHYLHKSMCALNKLTSLLKIGRCLNLEFCSWDEHLKKFTVNYKFTSKLAIFLELIAISVLVYMVLPKTTSIFLNVTQIALWLKMIATEYALIIYLLNSYNAQHKEITVYHGIQDLDNTLRQFSAVLDNSLVENFIKKCLGGFITYCIMFLCYALFYYVVEDSEEFLIFYVIPSMCSLYKSMLFTCTVLVLKERFHMINNFITNFTEKNCSMCSQNQKQMIRISVINSTDQRFCVDFSSLCELHAIRCASIVYEKNADVSSVLNDVWANVQNANLFWAFAEILYQCLTWYEILYKNLSVNWRWAVLSLIVLITALYTTFISIQACDDTKSEAMGTKRCLQKFYRRSKQKSIIKDDVQTFFLLILHRPTPFSSSGILSDTTNGSLVGLVRSRLEKKEDEADLSVPQEQIEVTQLNAYRTAAVEVATDKLETATENNKSAVKELDDNVSSTDATVAPVTTNEIEDEISAKEERPADFNDEKPLENKHDASVNNTQEQSTAAVEEESLAETEND
ncbi:hypothetical protein FQA39_LY13840 [Lamprigera yunnana]|nr:hypothetical protein FQA39_LY13840 [Lamprigera yunnana]